MEFPHLAAGTHYIAVKVITNARRNTLQEITATGIWRIHLAAKPIDGAANQALIRFLSTQLHIPPSHIRLMRGQTSPHKLLAITR